MDDLEAREVGAAIGRPGDEQAAIVGAEVERRENRRRRGAIVDPRLRHLGRVENGAIGDTVQLGMRRRRRGDLGNRSGSAFSPKLEFAPREAWTLRSADARILFRQPGLCPPVAEMLSAQAVSASTRHNKQSSRGGPVNRWNCERLRRLSDGAFLMRLRLGVRRMPGGLRLARLRLAMLRPVGFGLVLTLAVLGL